MVYFGLVALLIVITPLHRYVLATRNVFWPGILMPALWLGTNGVLALITNFQHQDSLLAVLGTLLLLSSWIAARIDHAEKILTATSTHRMAAK